MKKLPLNPVLRGPRDCFDLNVIVHSGKGHHCVVIASLKGLLPITFHSSRIMIYISAASVRTPQNWVRVNLLILQKSCDIFSATRNSFDTGDNPMHQLHFLYQITQLHYYYIDPVPTNSNNYISNISSYKPLYSHH